MSEDDDFKKFFNDEKAAISEMNTEQLREHREGLVQVVFELKARLAASEDELRERRKKKDASN